MRGEERELRLEAMGELREGTRRARRTTLRRRVLMVK
jgi:hypothetical protein